MIFSTRSSVRRLRRASSYGVGGNATFYEITASFNGTNPGSASLNATDPYGNKYAVCTTNQYDLRPSMNSSILTVLLIDSDAMTASKTSARYYSVVAFASPVSLSFSVSPMEFAPGDNVTLSATAVNPLLGVNDKTLPVQFLQDGNTTNLINSTTDQNGVATATWPYPNDGSPHTIMVQVAPGSSVANVTLMEQPVTLTVGSATALMLWTSLDYSSGDQVVYAQLLNGSTSLGNQAMTLTANGTAYALTTNNTGYVSLSGVLRAVDDNATFYQVAATFNGTNQLTSTCNVTDPYGHPYAACTTTQYGYMPAGNGTALTVWPQSTDASTMNETSAQMQQNAQNSGWLSIYNEWSWWYPWYRLHFKITVSDPTTIDAGVSLFPGGSTQSSNNVTIFNQFNEQFVESFVTDSITLMGSYALAKIGFWGGQPWISAIFLAIELCEDIIILRSQWNDKGEILAFAIVNIIMGFVATQGGFVQSFLNLLTGVSMPTMAPFPKLLPALDIGDNQLYVLSSICSANSLIN